MPPRWQGRRTTSSRAIFLVLCTGLLLTRRGRLPTRRQKLDQSLGDGQAVRWAAVDRWATERASARAPQPPRPSGYATLSGDGSSGGPDRRCLTGLLPLDGSEHPVPGLRLRGLSGERRRRAFSRATVAASLPCTSIMSLASFKSSESSIIMVASSITVLNAGGGSGRGDRPSRPTEKRCPFHRA